MILTYIFREGKILFLKNENRKTLKWNGTNKLDYNVSGWRKDVKSHILDMYQNTMLHDMFVYNIYEKKKPHTLESVHFYYVFKLLCSEAIFFFNC